MPPFFAGPQSLCSTRLLDVDCATVWQKSIDRGVPLEDDRQHWSDDRLLRAFQETGAEAPLKILYDRHNQELRKFCAFVCWRYQIGRYDAQLIEQLVEAPWLRLKQRHQTLAGFDAKRGSFPAYMRALVRDAIAQYRRKSRRKPGATGKFEDQTPPIDRVAPDELWLAAFHEFGATLHGAVKRYWDEVVLQQPTPVGIKPLSDVNKRRLKSRLWALFEQFTGA